MRKIHLKTWPEFYRLIISGEKNFVVRKNDRDFRKGDILILEEWDPAIGQHTGFSIEREIIYILSGGQFGIAEGFCVMSLGENK